MERKTLLAIAISFLFLIVYNSVVIAPQERIKSTKNPQAIQNNDVINIQPAGVDDFENADKDEILGAFKIRFSPTTGTIKEIYNTHYSYSSILSNFLDIGPDFKFRTYTNSTDTLTFYYDGNGQNIEKRIKPIDNNKLNIQIKFSALSNLENVHFNIFDIDGHRIKENKNAMRDSMLMEYSLNLAGHIFRKNNAFRFSDKDQKAEEKAVSWFGWRDRYHYALLRPNGATKNYKIEFVDNHRLRIGADVLPKSGGDSRIFEFDFFTGPQDLEILKNVDGDVYKIMAFSGYSLLDAIEKFIYNMLLLMNKYIKNWGVCIILISLLIYGATYPLTIKSMLSMRKMQEIQPKMAELREKYKNDPQKLNAEVVQLYRIHNVNPLAGCLPMLLQMPVFISLYQVLWRTHNFQGAKFLWIKDLSMPDRLFVFPQDLPFIGNELNILPVFMMIVMFFQQKLSAKNAIVADPTQEAQQKMMMYIFPFFIGAIFYHFASGLTLYFTVFYLLSTLTQYKMSKLSPIKK